jgi:hypothetical protein
LTKHFTNAHLLLYLIAPSKSFQQNRMKKKSLTLCLLTATFFVHAQNVGIGTTTPLARLHVKDSSVLFSATGEVPFEAFQGNPPVSGEGRRMMWYPGKAAFRAGYVFSTYWDKDNIGKYSAALCYDNEASGNYSFAAGAGNNATGSASTAMGSNTTASGGSSTAMGDNTLASNYNSTAMGGSTVASGQYSTAMGAGTTASGNSSTAMGEGSIASGNSSTAMGQNTLALGNASTSIGNISVASGYAAIAMGENAGASADYSIAIGQSVTSNSWISTSLGSYNDPIVTSPNFFWVPTDPLLIVGNGTGSADKKNAMVILKNGNIGIGINDPTATLEVARGTGDFGTAVFHGTAHISHFNFGANENTYIRAGTNDGYVILNDIPGGKVGIGIATPNAPLAFANDLGKKISLYESSPNSQYGFAVQPGQLQLYTDASAGKISFGYYSSGNFTERMYLNNSSGNLTVNGVYNSSDARLKKDIIPLQNSLQKIIQLNGYTYHWKNEQSGNSLQTGVLAQEVQKLFPQLVAEDNKGMLSVNYSGLIPVMIESIKEQQKQIDALSMHDKIQQQQIDELKKMVEKFVKQ